MASLIFRRFIRQPPPSSAGDAACASLSTFKQRGAHHSAVASSQEDGKNVNSGNWFTLPPYDSSINTSKMAKELLGKRIEGDSTSTTSMTARKWILRCCPQLPRSLIQKLFRLRQVMLILYSGVFASVSEKMHYLIPSRPDYERLVYFEIMILGEVLLVLLIFSKVISTAPYDSLQ